MLALSEGQEKEHTFSRKEVSSGFGAGECGLGHHWRGADLEVISVKVELL